VSAGQRPARLCLVLNVALVGGAEVLLSDVFRQFDPERVRPELVCLREAGPLGEELRREGFDVTVLGRRGWRDLRATLALWRYFRQRRPDVVLVPHFQRAPLVLGPWFGRLAGVPATVIAVHGMGMRAVGSRVLPWHVVETLGLVTDALALLVPSQGRYLREQEGVGRFPWRDAPEHYVPNGIHIPAASTPATRAEVRRELGLDDDDVVAVLVARLAPLKGHDDFLRAVARIAPAQPHLRAVLVGDGVLTEELTTLAEHLGIADRVVFTGLRRDVPRLLQSADLAVLPSLHEAVPISVIEEMAAGLPIVATDVGGLPDTVADGEEGIIVPPADVEALSAAVARLANDEELRRTMGKRGRQRAESEYSIENTTRAYERMIDSVLGR